MHIHQLWWSFWVLLLGVLSAQAQPVTIEVGKILERDIAGGQTHEYQVTLAAGEFMQVRVQQKGVDVVVILQDVNGQQLARMDSLNGKEGPEILSWVAVNAGEFPVKIQALDAKAAAGQYSITLIAKRPATPQDKHRVEVEKLFVDGLAIRRDEAQIETALAKLEAALHGWQELSDRRLADMTLPQVKLLISSKPEYKEGVRLLVQDTPETLNAAIMKFEEARRVAQRLRAKVAEAFCLVTIGETYIQLGESENAIARYKEALTIYQSIPDKEGEATTRSNIIAAPLEAKKASMTRQRKEKKIGLHPKLIVQTGHSYWVGSVAFSPDGKLLASGSWDKTIKLWEVSSGQELRTLTGPFEAIASVAFSPDGKWLASSSGDSTISLWDIASGQELRTLISDSEAVHSVAFSPDGKTLASVGDKTTKLWEVATGRELRNLASHSKNNSTYVLSYVGSVAFSPDGKWLVSSSGDKTIKLWELASGRELYTLAGHSQGVRSVAFSPDGKLLASSSEDKTIKLWELASGRELYTLAGHSQGVRSVAFSPDGKLLASGSRDKTIKLWEVASGRELYTLAGHSQAVASVAFSPDGKLLASGSRDKTIKLWEVASGQELHTLAGHSHEVVSVAFSPDRKTLASGGDKTIKLREVASGRELYSLAGHSQRVRSVAFSPDGKLLASSSEDKTIKLWELASGRELYTLAGHSQGVTSIAFSPDGKRLASSSEDKTIKLWEVASGRELHNLAGHSEAVVSVAFSPDGKLLASGSYDKTIKLWEVTTGRELRTIIGQADLVLSVAFSPDRKTLASGGDKTIKLWEVASGRELYTLAGHSQGITSIAFSPDGKTLVSGSFKRTDKLSLIIKLWEVASGQEVPLPATLPDWVGIVGSDNLATINGKVIRVEVEEGTKIVFVDTATEAPLATLIALNEKDWVVVDEEGRFDASDGALQLMHYAYGLEIIGFDQLKDEYYEPNLLQKLLGYNTEPLRAVVPLQDVKLPPDVREQTLSPDGKRLTLKLVNRGGGIGKTEIFLNNKLVIPDARSATLRQNPNVPLNEVVTLMVDLPVTSYLPGKENQIKVVTSNYLTAIKRGNIQSSARGVAYLDRRKSEDTLPSVYALVSGVSDYEGEALDLRFAAKDAEDFAAALALGARRLFCPPNNLQCLDKVNITTLSTNRTKAEEQPTKENFKRALGAIAAKAKPEDIVVIYLAGHGVSLGVNTDTYFYLTKEAKSAAREDLTKNYQTVAISSEELRDWLTQTEWRAGIKGIKPLKQVLILDTCAAGTAASQLALTTKRELSGDQIRAIEFLKDKTGTFVLMGSAADAPSYEASRYGQGLLTYALLQGMKGAALDKSEYVDVQTLFSYAQKEVPRMAANIGGIQRPIISAPLGRTFVIGQMTEAEKGQVRLPSPKPLLLRPLLTNPETGDDDLKLIPALRKRFDAESSYEMMKRSNRGEPTMVYVDDDSFPEALRLTGTYTVVGDKVRVTAFLRRDGKTVATLAEVFTVKENVVDELVNAVRNVLGQLRE